MDKLVLQAVEEVALEGPEGCTAGQLWQLLESRLPPEVNRLTQNLKTLVIAEICKRSDVVVKTCPAASCDQPSTEASSDETMAPAPAVSTTIDMEGTLLVRKTLELAGKSRDKGVVQPDAARICNIPHKNFFIVVKTLETHSLVVRSDIQVRNGKGTMSKTSILHLPRFAPKLAPGLQFAKQQSDASLYAVTDDDATIAYLLKTMREMDPEGVGIVRSEFKKYTLRRMHSGNLRQNHRLWRRLQAKMQKLGVLELDVHTDLLHTEPYICLLLKVQGSDRTTIRAVKPKCEEADAQGSASAWPLVAEQSFAREFYHVVLNAGQACTEQMYTLLLPATAE
ncbi:hypothetical protein ABBQ38_008357 [Trebouxia sp. C0009 RCD-2024]